MFIEFIGQQPLEHSLMLDHLTALHRQDKDIVVHLLKFLVPLRPHLRVDVPKQDQILEDDDVRNTDV